MLVVNSMLAALFAFIYVCLGIILARICGFEDRKDFMAMIIFWPLAVVMIVGITICLSIDKLINKIIHRRK